jgi:hypothetical protein
VFDISTPEVNCYRIEWSLVGLRHDLLKRYSEFCGLCNFLFVQIRIYEGDFYIISASLTLFWSDGESSRSRRCSDALISSHGWFRAKLKCAE